MQALVSTEVQLTVGVDTHADVHVAAALDQLGRLLETHSVPTTPEGYRELVAWAGSLGTPERFGIEGTSSYGAGLARWLRGRGFDVVEVERPERQKRRRRGKSDVIDAEAAARAVHRLGRRLPSRRPGTVRSRCCASCRQPDGQHSWHAPRPPISCMPSSSPPQIPSAPDCDSSAGPGSWRPQRLSDHGCH
jgi:transposase